MGRKGTAGRGNVGDLRRAALAAGARIENRYTRLTGEYRVIAPPGKVWACDGSHAFTISWEGPVRKTVWSDNKNAAVAGAIRRIDRGVVDCEIENCQLCQHGTAEDATS